MLIIDDGQSRNGPRGVSSLTTVYDAVIVGARIAGATLAMMLGDRCVDFILGLDRPVANVH